MLKPKMVVIHHSATPDTGTLSWGAIQDYHVNHNGWSDVGYHAGIEQAGDRFLCFFGRPDVLAGAHTVGQNGRSLGFCFVGNFDEVAPGRSRLIVAARRVLAPWLLRYGLGPGDIVPHSQFASKSCPGKLFSMSELRDIVAEELDALRRKNAG
jgi:N-acetylmuramoyl-L-alanine amidase